MTESRSSAAHASVVHLRIHAFAERSVSERTDIKKRLEALVEPAMSCLRQEERIVVDAVDGIAVAVLGNPRAAFDFANRLRTRAQALPLAIGLSHGPVKAMEGAGGPVLVGAALDEGSLVAQFAGPDRIFASGGFREALLGIAPDRARHFAAAGTMSDASERSHELFVAEIAVVDRRRRRFFAVTGATALALVGTAVLARYFVGSTRPAILEFEIKPQAEVFVDGVSKGKSPPLNRLEVSAGKHLVEVRSGRYEPLVLELDLKPGEEMSLRHTFGAPGGSRSFKQRLFDVFR